MGYASNNLDSFVDAVIFFWALSRRTVDPANALKRSNRGSFGGGDSMVYLDWVQWPAMLVTVLAAWLIGSQRPAGRMTGFICFSLSNVLWVIWGAHAEAHALIALQICLFFMNLRGFKKNLEGH
jgi:hypothetical protein